MILIYVFIFIVTVVGIHKCTEQESSDYIGKKQSTAIKGIFVLLVFASHAGQYLFDLVPQVTINMVFLNVKMLLGQLIVVPFLFYSGYGVRFSVERKGTVYIQTFPIHRILRTYVHVLVILCAFLLLQLAFGVQYTAGSVIRSFVLWDSFGNSNWYMFAILSLYIATAASFLLLKKYRASISAVVILTIVYMLIMSKYKDSYWYSTVLLYPFGMMFYDWQETFRLKKKQSRGLWIMTIFSCFVLVLLLTVVSFENQFLEAVLYNFKGIFLMTMILALTVRIRIQNALLMWLGNHVFELYLLQRLPMIALTNWGIAASSPIIWLVLSAVITVILAIGFKKGLSALDEVLFKV